jgi:hypothetical protein
MRVATEHAGRQLDFALSREIADRDARDLETETRTRFDLVCLLLGELDKRCADVSAAQDADPNAVTV